MQAVCQNRAIIVQENCVNISAEKPKTVTVTAVTM